MLTQGAMPVVNSGTTCGQTSSTTGITPPTAGTLIITAVPACKTYNGVTYSGGNGVTYDGFLNGDTPSILGGTLTYGGTSQGVKNVGTYTITPGGLTSNSYNIVYVDSTLTISPVSLTLTGISTTKLDSSTSSATITSIGGLVGGDTLTLTNATTINQTVSTGSLYLSTASLTGAGLTNYSGGTVTTTGILTISSATVVSATVSIAP
jgi:hypothetical protein